MCSNWMILPLNLLDKSELELQRCLIPYQEDGVVTINGAWCKCVLEDGSYTVCRVEQRAGAERSCFVDGLVASAGFVTNKQRVRCLEPLALATNVERVICTVHITEQLLRRPQISLEQLHQDVAIFMRHLKLMKGCHVQHERLLKLGIASIEICDVLGPDLASNSCFELTTLEISDVHLPAATTLPRIKRFQPHGFEAPLQALEQLLQSSRRAQFKGLPLNALLVGAVGSGKSCLLAEFLHRHNCNCFNITASQVLRSQPGETEAELRRIFHSAHSFQQLLHPKQPIVILLEDLELLCPATSSSDARNSGNAVRITAQLYKLIDELPQRSRGILCLASSSAPNAVHPHARRAGRFGHEICIDMPTELQRRQLFAGLWQQQLEEQQQQEQDLQLLTPALLVYVAQQTQGYVIADLTLLLRQLQQRMLNLSPTPAEFDLLLRNSLLQLQPSASRATDVRVLKLSTGFESIGGMAALKRTLQVSVLAALRHSEAHARFGLSLPKGLLLYGPPGCAKTSIAKCLAKEANMTFIASSAAEVYSPYVGCAERFITQIFNTARKNAPCLIFLDEIDSLVGRRTVGNGSGGGVQLRILSTLLTEMDGIVSGDNVQHILVVAATNRPDMLDDALLRPGRFDKLIHVPAPDLTSRLALLQLHAQRMPFHANVQLEEIAARTERYSGADLCNLCNEAAIEAFQRDFNVSHIELQDFETVLARQKSSLDQRQIESYYKFAARHL
ncbi:PREDICTED: spermatogenesis-associated protein 5-like protein 1 [Drosophila arizonae]|uniref:Spermatogenesis-associated protein 5-like protein 1 n=1 Tax=Drosophila arizonae TaxID=7263 RepID=A0ABM1NWY3_DROAR|nr:PREDICTED: spermatogenesis-associated protein 5-like protein 1 [Drosophila arizonae]